MATRLAAAGADVIVVEAGGEPTAGPMWLPGRACCRCSPPPTGNAECTLTPVAAGGRAVRIRSHRRRQRLHQRDGLRARAPPDYDDWAATGCDGWSYDDVLPHFRAIENWVDGADEYRGDAGPISVSWCGHDHPVDDAFIAAAVDAGHEPNPTTTAHRRRVCPRVRLISDEGSGRRRRGVYAPRPTRPATTTADRTHAERIVVENGRATGIDCGGTILRPARK